MDRSERKIKQTVSHNAETADRDRVKNKETYPDRKSGFRNKFKLFIIPTKEYKK